MRGAARFHACRHPEASGDSAMSDRRTVARFRDRAGAWGFRDDKGPTGEFRAVWRDWGLAHYQWGRRGQSVGGYG